MFRGQSQNCLDPTHLSAHLLSCSFSWHMCATHVLTTQVEIHVAPVQVINNTGWLHTSQSWIFIIPMLKSNIHNVSIYILSSRTTLSMSIQLPSGCVSIIPRCWSRYCHTVTVCQARNYCANPLQGGILLSGIQDSPPFKAKKCLPAIKPYLL